MKRKHIPLFGITCLNWYYAPNKSKERVNMSSLFTHVGWLIANVPQVLDDEAAWKLWYRSLSESEISNLKVNANSIRLCQWGLMCSSDDLPVGSEEQTRVFIIVERLDNILTSKRV